MAKRIKIEESQIVSLKHTLDIHERLMLIMDEVKKTIIEKGIDEARNVLKRYETTIIEICMDDLFIKLSK